MQFLRVLLLLFLIAASNVFCQQDARDDMSQEQETNSEAVEDNVEPTMLQNESNQMAEVVFPSRMNKEASEMVEEKPMTSELVEEKALARLIKALSKQESNIREVLQGTGSQEPEIRLPSTGDEPVPLKEILTQEESESMSEESSGEMLEPIMPVEDVDIWESPQVFQKVVNVPEDVTQGTTLMTLTAHHPANLSMDFLCINPEIVICYSDKLDNHMYQLRIALNDDSDIPPHFGVDFHVLIPDAESGTDTIFKDKKYTINFMYERDQSTMEPMSKSTVMNVVVNSNQIPVHHNKPVFEFMPQFEKEKYEILVPEGTNEKSATMAIVYFMSRVNGPAPTFEIMGDIQEWFKIGEINTQQDSNRVLSAVEIMLKKGVKVEAKEKQLPYQFTLEAKQADATASATVTVDILSFEKSETPKTSVLTESPSTEPPPVEVKTSSKPETTSTTSEDVISSTEPEITEATIGTVIVELTEGRKNIEAVIKEIEAIPETIAIDAGEEMSTSIPVGIEEEMPETEETMDNKLFTVGSSNMKTTSKAPTPASVQLLPEIDFNLNVNGVTNGQILVSESLVDGEAVPGVEIHITADQESHNELVDLELLFSDAFIVRPRRVPVGGTAQLIVANSRMLDFETAPTTFTAELRASLTYNPNMVKTKMLQFRKKDEPDHAPYFTNSFFEFEVFENSVTGEAVGQLKAHDEDVNEQLSFELFGEGSELFAINDDVLIVSCKTALPCLDREQTDAYYFALVAIDKAGYMSDPVTITIRVKDKNDNLPKLEIGDEPIRISNGALLTSAVFSVHDADLYPNYVVDVDGSAASFLEISKVSEDFYQIRPKHGSIPSTGSFVLELGVRDPTNNQADKKSVDVQVKNSFSKARFRRPRYERTITSEKIHKGNPLVQVELEGVPVDSVKFVILNSNSSWLSIDDYGGNVFVGDVPDRGVKSGHHSADIGVVDRTTKAILAQTQLLLTVIGSRKNESIFLSRFYTHTVPADQSHLNTVVELSTNEERPNIVIITDSINAWNADQKPEHFPANSIIVDRSRIMVNFEHASNLRSVQFEVASVEDFSDRALITIFFSADPKKEAERKKLMSKPLFTAPWTEDSVIIPVRLVEEAPIGQIATSLPAYDPMTGNHISNVELKGEMESFFTLDTITQNVHVAKRIDFESLTAEMRAFDLELVAGVDNYKTSAILRFQIVDIDDNTPRFGFLGQPLRNNSFAVMENSPPGTEIVRFRVSDNDELDGKQKFKYRLSGIGQDKFQIREVADSMVLVVSPVGDLDREAVDLMAIIITVEDSAGNVNTANLFITLEDQNDNAPRFQEQKVNVKLTENWQVGSTVTRLLAHDSDKNENARLHFFLENGTNPYFEVDSETGLVTTVKSLNGLARIEPYEIVVVCEDAGNPKQSARSTVMVTVVESILTNNEEKNELTIQSPPIGHVIKLSENTPANHRVYQVVAQVGSFDTADIKYSLKPITNKDEGFFNIDETSGEIFTAKRLDYENTSRITVLVSARAIFQDGKNDSRLLHVEIVDEDDNEPAFLQRSQETPYLFTIQDHSAILGHLAASDEDNAPYNGFNFYLLPSCANRNAHFSINQETGELKVTKPHVLVNESRIHLCALVSPIPDLGSAPEIAFDRHNRSMVSFTVRLNKQILAEQKKLEPIITLRNNSHVTIENTLMDTKIPISNLNGKDGHLSYRIKNVEFTKSEYDENIEADNSKPISLFSLSPTTGDLHMDSDVVDHPEGIYKVDIHANKKASNEYFASLVSEVHFVNPSVKLKFSFDQSRDVIGLNLGVFEQKLTDAIRSEGLGPDLSVYLDRPETYKDVEGTNVNKSTACFYVVRGNTVLSLEHSIEAISASANSESPLTRLYQVYKVINIERCTEPAPFRRMAHFFSPYTFVWIIVTLACVLILIAMFGYMCFLTKYRDYLRRKELDFATQMEKKPPVDDFTIPQYINLNINQCL